MNFEVLTTHRFERSAKALMKRYRSLKMDLEDFISSLEENPNQGTELSPGLRKIRMAISSKGKGKSGGARVITYTIVISENAGKVYLIDIYDKSEYSSIDIGKIKEVILDLGITDIDNNVGE